MTKVFKFVEMNVKSVFSNNSFELIVTIYGLNTWCDKELKTLVKAPLHFLKIFTGFVSIFGKLYVQFTGATFMDKLKSYGMHMEELTIDTWQVFHDNDSDICGN